SILRLKRLEPHTKAVLGAMRLCEHAKVPWRILTQKAAESETLGGYPILLLPEVFILTEKMTEVLTRYVREGGLLVAAHDTGLYNDHGVRMDRNTLSGLLGVDVIHTDNRYARNGWGAYLRPTGPFAPGRYGETTPPVSSRFNSTKADGAEVLMEYRLPAVPVDDGHWVNWWSPPPGPLSGGAALTKKQTGKGLAFYAGFDLFTMAADREYPHLNDLMTGILQYASAPPPIRLETDTPDYLYTGFFENGTKLYLHQIIHPPKHYDGMIPAVPGGAAVLPKDIPVKEAWLVYPVRRELAVSVEKDAQRIALPSVETNSIVEITLCE
ncbi:MAG: beta-galactosidase trimerization domain-containing protein, partial [Clostridia bacterium]|nr:beta-galactosidase trimerization domain-containing protein [Clostridia bacterium]